MQNPSGFCHCGSCNLAALIGWDRDHHQLTEEATQTSLSDSLAIRKDKQDPPPPFHSFALHTELVGLSCVKIQQQMILSGSSRPKWGSHPRHSLDQAVLVGCHLNSDFGVQAGLDVLRFWIQSVSQGTPVNVQNAREECRRECLTMRVCANF